jgi:cellulose synthase (UDP-forming)
MRWILDLFLMTPARQALADRYRQYRQYNEASPFRRGVGLFLVGHGLVLSKTGIPALAADP